jgi:GT2 family glycosyltransferase
MDLSIVIVNWNTRVLLNQCLRSIATNPPECQYEILVVDNASSDDSSRMVQCDFPHVNLLVNGANVGFSRANNQGIRESRGRIVLLLNSDTLVHPGALQRLVDHLDRQPEVGIAGARLMNSDGTIQYYPTACPTLANQIANLCYLPGRYEFGVGATTSSQYCEVERVQGAFLGIKRAVLDQIGLMEESLFLYTEEDDLCKRARLAGWKVHFLPQVHVTHYGGASTEQVSASSLQHLYRSKLWFIRKYQKPTDATILKIVLFASCLIRGVFGIALGSPAMRTRSRNYFKLLRVLPGL